jgi:hypothetical protein
MRFKAVAFALLFIVLGILSLSSILINQQTLAATVWIIVLGPACAAMLFISKNKLQIKRWAACIFAVNVFSLTIAWLFGYYPHFIQPSFSGHGASVADFYGPLFILVIFIVGYGLNLFAILSLFLGSLLAKSGGYLAGGFIAVAGSYISFILFFSGELSSDYLFFLGSVTLVVVNVITLFRLRQIN